MNWSYTQEVSKAKEAVKNFVDQTGTILMTIVAITVEVGQDFENVAFPLEIFDQIEEASATKLILKKIIREEKDWEDQMFQIMFKEKTVFHVMLREMIKTTRLKIDTIIVATAKKKK